MVTLKSYGMKGNKMELHLHDVQSISLKGQEEAGRGEPYKIIRIKINGWQNVITLYCKEDVRLDIPEDLFASIRQDQADNDAQIAAWQDEGGEG